MRTHHALWLRLLSLAILVCFLTTDTLRVPAFAARPDARAPQPPVRSLLNARIPTDLGWVEDRFSGNRPQSVVLIQDAHALPEAQRAIEGLLGHLRKQHGLGLVAFEGAPSRLDARLFQSFPDRERLARVLESYRERGELTGVTAASLFDVEGRYEGIEDWQLFEEGYAAYLRASAPERSLEEKLTRLEEGLERRKRALYSPDLLKVDELLRGLEARECRLIDALLELARVKPPPAGSGVAALLELVERSEWEWGALEHELKTFARNLKPFIKDPRERARFAQHEQAFRTGRFSAGAFAEYLGGLSSPLRMAARLWRLLRSERRRERARGAAFTKAFERYAESVKESLFRSPGERALDRAGRRLALIQKLARLELTRSEWQELRSSLRAAKVPGTFSAHIAFYENAEQRDQAMFERLQSLLRKGERAAVVAGGFHTEALTARLRQEGISYLLVTPRVMGVPQDSAYRAQMQGDVSWKHYLRVENGRIALYEPFVRALRDRLLEGSDRSTLLKRWRDQIVRDLAQEGDVEAAGEYTRFLDELAVDRQDVLTRWLANAERFIAGLRGLDHTRGLTEQDLLKLLNLSRMSAPFPASGLVPRAGLSAKRFGLSAGRLAAKLESRHTAARSDEPWLPAVLGSARPNQVVWLEDEQGRRKDFRFLHKVHHRPGRYGRLVFKVEREGRMYSLKVSANPEEWASAAAIRGSRLVESELLFMRAEEKKVPVLVSEWVTAPQVPGQWSFRAPALRPVFESLTLDDFLLGLEQVETLARDAAAASRLKEILESIWLDGLEAVVQIADAGYLSAEVLSLNLWVTEEGGRWAAKLGDFYKWLSPLDGVSQQDAQNFVTRLHEFVFNLLQTTPYKVERIQRRKRLPWRASRLVKKAWELYWVYGNKSPKLATVDDVQRMLAKAREIVAELRQSTGRSGGERRPPRSWNGITLYPKGNAPFTPKQFWEQVGLYAFGRWDVARHDFPALAQELALDAMSAIVEVADGGHLVAGSLEPRLQVVEDSGRIAVVLGDVSGALVALESVSNDQARAFIQGVLELLTTFLARPVDPGNAFRHYDEEVPAAPWEQFGWAVHQTYTNKLIGEVTVAEARELLASLRLLVAASRHTAARSGAADEMWHAIQGAEIARAAKDPVAMRTAAQELESLAPRVEQEGRKELADEMRKTARSLRAQADAIAPEKPQAPQPAAAPPAKSFAERLAAPGPPAEAPPKAELATRLSFPQTWLSQPLPPPPPVPSVGGGEVSAGGRVGPAPGPLREPLPSAARPAAVTQPTERVGFLSDRAWPMTIVPAVLLGVNLTNLLKLSFFGVTVPGEILSMPSALALAGLVYLAAFGIKHVSRGNAGHSLSIILAEAALISASLWAGGTFLSLVGFLPYTYKLFLLIALPGYFVLYMLPTGVVKLFGRKGFFKVREGAFSDPEILRQEVWRVFRRKAAVHLITVALEFALAAALIVFWIPLPGEVTVALAKVTIGAGIFSLLYSLQGDWPVRWRVDPEGVPSGGAVFRTVWVWILLGALTLGLPAGMILQAVQRVGWKETVKVLTTRREDPLRQMLDDADRVIPVGGETDLELRGRAWHGIRRSNNFIVFYPADKPELAAKAEEVAGRADALHARVHARWVGGQPAQWEGRQRVVVLLYPDLLEYTRTWGRRGIACNYLQSTFWSGRTDVHVVALTADDNLLGYQEHEYGHVVMERLFSERQDAVPKWATEGIASFEENNRDRRLELVQNPKDGDRLWSWRELMVDATNSAFVNDLSDRETAIFYAQSYLLVRFLVEQGGEKGEQQLTRFMELVNEGRRQPKPAWVLDPVRHIYERTLEEVYGFRLEELDSKVNQWLEILPQVRAVGRSDQQEAVEPAADAKLPKSAVLSEREQLRQFERTLAVGAQGRLQIYGREWVAVRRGANFIVYYHTDNLPESYDAESVAKQGNDVAAYLEYWRRDIYKSWFGNENPSDWKGGEVAHVFLWGKRADFLKERGWTAFLAQGLEHHVRHPETGAITFQRVDFVLKSGIEQSVPHELDHAVKAHELTRIPHWANEGMADDAQPDRERAMTRARLNQSQDTKLPLTTQEVLIGGHDRSALSPRVRDLTTDFPEVSQTLVRFLVEEKGGEQKFIAFLRRINREVEEARSRGEKNPVQEGVLAALAEYGYRSFASLDDQWRAWVKIPGPPITALGEDGKPLAARPTRLGVMVSRLNQHLPVGARATWRVEEPKQSTWTVSRGTPNFVIVYPADRDGEEMRKIAMDVSRKLEDLRKRMYAKILDEPDPPHAKGRGFVFVELLPKDAPDDAPRFADPSPRVEGTLDLETKTVWYHMSDVDVSDQMESSLARVVAKVLENQEFAAWGQRMPIWASDTAPLLFYDSLLRSMERAYVVDEGHAMVSVRDILVGGWDGDSVKALPEAQVGRILLSGELLARFLIEKKGGGQKFLTFLHLTNKLHAELVKHSAEKPVDGAVRTNLENIYGYGKQSGDPFADLQAEWRAWIEAEPKRQSAARTQNLAEVFSLDHLRDLPTDELVRKLILHFGHFFAISPEQHATVDRLAREVVVGAHGRLLPALLLDCVAAYLRDFVRVSRKHLQVYQREGGLLKLIDGVSRTAAQAVRQGLRQVGKLVDPRSDSLYWHGHHFKAIVKYRRPADPVATYAHEVVHLLRHNGILRSEDPLTYLLFLWLEHLRRPKPVEASPLAVDKFAKLELILIEQVRQEYEAWKARSAARPRGIRLAWHVLLSPFRFILRIVATVVLGGAAEYEYLIVRAVAVRLVPHLKVIQATWASLKGVAFLPAVYMFLRAHLFEDSDLMRMQLPMAVGGPFPENIRVLGYLYHFAFNVVTILSVPREHRLTAAGLKGMEHEAIDARLGAYFPAERRERIRQATDALIDKLDASGLLAAERQAAGRARKPKRGKPAKKTQAVEKKVRTEQDVYSEAMSAEVDRLSGWRGELVFRLGAASLVAWAATVALSGGLFGLLVWVLLKAPYAMKIPGAVAVSALLAAGALALLWRASSTFLYDLAPALHHLFSFGSARIANHIAGERARLEKQAPPARKPGFWRRRSTYFHLIAALVAVLYVVQTQGDQIADHVAANVQAGLRLFLDLKLYVLSAYLTVLAIWGHLHLKSVGFRASEIDRADTNRRRVLSLFAPLSEGVAGLGVFCLSKSFFEGYLGLAQPLDLVLPFLGVHIGWGLSIGTTLTIALCGELFHLIHMGSERHWHKWIWGAAVAYAFHATGSLVAPATIHVIDNVLTLAVSLIMPWAAPLNGRTFARRTEQGTPPAQGGRQAAARAEQPSEELKTELDVYQEALREVGGSAGWREKLVNAFVGASILAWSLAGGYAFLHFGAFIGLLMDWPYSMGLPAALGVSVLLAAALLAFLFRVGGVFYWEFAPMLTILFNWKNAWVARRVEEKIAGLQNQPSRVAEERLRLRFVVYATATSAVVGLAYVVVTQWGHVLGHVMTNAAAGLRLYVGLGLYLIPIIAIPARVIMHLHLKKLGVREGELMRDQRMAYWGGGLLAPLSEAIVGLAIFWVARAFFEGALGLTEPLKVTLFFVDLPFGFGLSIGTLLAGALCAEIFYWMHFPENNWSTWISGAAMVYAYIATGSLIAPAVIHLIDNGLLFLQETFMNKVFPLDGPLVAGVKRNADSPSAASDRQSAARARKPERRRGKQAKAGGAKAPMDAVVEAWVKRSRRRRLVQLTLFAGFFAFLTAKWGFGPLVGLGMALVVFLAERVAAFLHESGHYVAARFRWRKDFVPLELKFLFSFGAAAVRSERRHATVERRLVIDFAAVVVNALTAGLGLAALAWLGIDTRLEFFMALTDPRVFLAAPALFALVHLTSWSLILALGNLIPMSVGRALRSDGSHIVADLWDLVAGRRMLKSLGPGKGLGERQRTARRLGLAPGAPLKGMRMLQRIVGDSSEPEPLRKEADRAIRNLMVKPRPLDSAERSHLKKLQGEVLERVRQMRAKIRTLMRRRGGIADPAHAMRGLLEDWKRVAAVLRSEETVLARTLYYKCLDAVRALDEVLLPYQADGAAVGEGILQKLALAGQATRWMAWMIPSVHEADLLYEVTVGNTRIFLGAGADRLAEELEAQEGSTGIKQAASRVAQAIHPELPKRVRADEVRGLAAVLRGSDLEAFADELRRSIVDLAQLAQASRSRSELQPQSLAEGIEILGVGALAEQAARKVA